MDIKKVKLIYFSPMGKTKKIIEGISQGLDIDHVEQIDLADFETGTQPVTIHADTLVVFGVPVYGGQIPEEALNRLNAFKSEKTLAVAVVVYGNREYDGALCHLRNIIIENGFIPLAGGAFIGELSISEDGIPIAEGRPDQHDIDKTHEFGSIIQMKLTESKNPDKISPIRVPGTDPYQEKVNPSDLCPVTFQSSCMQCESCISACPTEAISLADGVKTNRSNCVLCCACIKKCPFEARVMEEPVMKQKVRLADDQKTDRKEPEMYL